MRQRTRIDMSLHKEEEEEEGVVEGGGGERGIVGAGIFKSCFADLTLPRLTILIKILSET